MDQLHDANPLERQLVAKATAARIPITAAFELTPGCNMRCDMCYIRLGKEEIEKKGGIRRSDYWLQQAEELKNLGTLFILLTGGEPLLHPDFSEIYTRLRENGFILTINTNGTLITEETAQMFKRLKPRRVNVTLYGASNETYRKLCHTPNGFDKCMQGLLLLKENNIDTKLNLSIVKENLHEYTQLLDIARSLDIPAEVNSYMFACKRNDCKDGYKITDARLDAIEAAKAEVDYLRYKYGKNFKQLAQEYVKEPLTPRQEPLVLYCRAGKSSLWLNWKGEMTACCTMEQPMEVIDGTPLKEKWQKIVAKCTSLTPHEECRECKLANKCNVCYSSATHEKQAGGSIDYVCQMTKTKIEEITKAANEED